MTGLFTVITGAGVTAGGVVAGAGPADGSRGEGGPMTTQTEAAKGWGNAYANEARNPAGNAHASGEWTRNPMSPGMPPSAGGGGGAGAPGGGGGSGGGGGGTGAAGAAGGGAATTPAQREQYWREAEADLQQERQIEAEITQLKQQLRALQATIAWANSPSSTTSAAPTGAAAGATTATTNTNQAAINAANASTGTSSTTSTSASGQTWSQYVSGLLAQQQALDAQIHQLEQQAAQLRQRAGELFAESRKTAGGPVVKVAYGVPEQITMSAGALVAFLDATSG